MDKKEHIVDITKKSRIELEEMIAREKKLLSDKSFIARLPDKGNKIRNFYNKLFSELEKHCNIDQVVDQLSSIQITVPNVINSLEWSKEEITDKEIPINSSSTAKQKDIRIINPDPSVIADSSEIEESCSFNDELEVYSKNIITFDTNRQTSKTVQFKPFYTTKTDVHNPTKEKHRKRLTVEITSATPPALQHQKAVTLSLYESINLQVKQKENLQKIEQQNAVERMQRINKILKNHGINSNLPLQPNEQFSKFFTKYREENSTDSENSFAEDNSDLEAHDEDDEPRGGGVNVVVFSPE